MQENNMMIPGISLCQKWGKIRIFHSTIVALGEPRYIRFLFNPDKKGLVVQACARKEAECFRVPKYNPENWEFKISSVPMLRMIWNTCNWDKEKTYRLTGMCHIEHVIINGVMEDVRFVVQSAIMNLNQASVQYADMNVSGIVGLREYVLSVEKNVHMMEHLICRRHGLITTGIVMNLNL